MQPPPSAPLLDVENLQVRFTANSLSFDAVCGISFSISAGQVFCLVGESGCGKSLTAKALLRLVPETARIGGSLRLHGQNLLELAPEAMRRLRGLRMGMIFQEPMTALNPVLRVGDQVMEPLRLHLGLSAQAARERCAELFFQAGIPAPEGRMHDYPHQLSGGMRQRVIIAMALACEPSLLLADEPTTALDVTIQGQILSLIRHLSHERGMGTLLITHDLGVVAQAADSVGVMYAGRLVESGPVEAVFAAPRHPYTRGLMRSAPTSESRHMRRLPVIAGSVPPPEAMPPGCPFHPRCPESLPVCAEKSPPRTGTEHTACCWLSGS